MHLFTILLRKYIFLISCYVCLLTAVFCIPNSCVEDNAMSSIDSLVVKQENQYMFNRDIKLLCDGPASYIDALTDATMLTRNINYNNTDNNAAKVIQRFFSLPLEFNDSVYRNPLYNAMNMNGYGRYWQGYEVILRPLLVFFDYHQIRFFNIFVFLTLTYFVGRIFCKNIGEHFLGYFFLSLFLCKFFLIPLSLQFMNMFVLMMVAILMLQRRITKGLENELLLCRHDNFYEFSFVIGSLTAFFDFLTTPLLPWGMCTLYLIVYMYEKKNYIMSFGFYIKSCIIWGFSYLFTWLSKWVIYAICIDSSIIQQVYVQILTRISGDIVSDYGISYHINRIAAVYNNIWILFSPISMDFVAFIICIGIVFIAYLRYKFPKLKRNGIYEAQLFTLSLLPIFWYAVIANHSEIHFWFTYRNLMISVMALCVYFEAIIDWKSFTSWIKGKVYDD